MITEIAMGAGAAAAGGYAYARGRRSRLYRNLAGRIASAPSSDLAALNGYARPDFHDRLATVADFLPGPAFAALKQEAERLLSPERSFVPTHKKGGTVAYETLIQHAPGIPACYHAPELTGFISRVVGLTVRPTPLHDQSSLSVLSYDRPGDHIGWHFDHNFYRGPHFTVLLSLRNEGSADGGLSHATLEARVNDREIQIATPPNMLVVFEGARVRHRVTPLLEGERRLILSMTYCTDPRSFWWQGASRRLKDTAFFGLRALWT